MGPAELFGLRRSDLHLREGYLRVQQDLVEVEGKIHLGDTKTPKRRRKIPLPKIAIDALRERLKLSSKEAGKESELVFTSTEGGPIRLNNLRNRWWQPLLLRAAEIAIADGARKRDPGYRFPTDLHLYELRHTSNALMGMLEVPIQVASERMGQSSIQTTVDVYGHLYSSQGRAVAEKFDAFFEKLPRPKKRRK
jgi:integrase